MAVRERTKTPVAAEALIPAAGGCFSERRAWSAPPQRLPPRRGPGSRGRPGSARRSPPAPSPARAPRRAAPSRPARGRLNPPQKPEPPVVPPAAGGPDPQPQPGRRRPLSAAGSAEGAPSEGAERCGAGRSREAGESFEKFGFRTHLFAFK